MPKEAGRRDGPEEAVADALRKVAVQLEIAIDERRRSKHLDADDLLETLLAVADELDSPVPAETPAPPTP